DERALLPLHAAARRRAEPREPLLRPRAPEPARRRGVPRSADTGARARAGTAMTRHCVRRVLVALVALSTVTIASRHTAAEDAARPVLHARPTMGTYGHVTLVTPDSAASQPLADLALAAFGRVDSLMSNWTTTSEVARVNREAGRPGGTKVEPEVARVIDLSLQLWRETGGAFDITVEPLVRLWGFLGGPRGVPSAGEVAATLPPVRARHLR